MKGQGTRLSESIYAEELERAIHSAILRIEQQGLHVAKLSASPAQAAEAQLVRDGMIEGLQQLRLRRAKFL